MATSERVFVPLAVETWDFSTLLEQKIKQFNNVEDLGHFVLQVPPPAPQSILIPRDNLFFGSKSGKKSGAYLQPKPDKIHGGKGSILRFAEPEDSEKIGFWEVKLTVNNINWLKIKFERIEADKGTGSFLEKWNRNGTQDLIKKRAHTPLNSNNDLIIPKLNQKNTQSPFLPLVLPQANLLPSISNVNVLENPISQPLPNIIMAQNQPNSLHVPPSFSNPEAPTFDHPCGNFVSQNHSFPQIIQSPISFLPPPLLNVQTPNQKTLCTNCVLESEPEIVFVTSRHPTLISFCNNCQAKYPSTKQHQDRAKELKRKLLRNLNSPNLRNFSEIKECLKSEQFFNYIFKVCSRRQMYEKEKFVQFDFLCSALCYLCDKFSTVSLPQAFADNFLKKFHEKELPQYEDSVVYLMQFLTQQLFAETMSIIDESSTDSPNLSVRKVILSFFLIHTGVVLLLDRTQNISHVRKVDDSFYYLIERLCNAFSTVPITNAHPVPSSRDDKERIIRVNEMFLSLIENTLTKFLEIIRSWKLYQNVQQKQSLYGSTAPFSEIHPDSFRKIVRDIHEKIRSEENAKSPLNENDFILFAIQLGNSPVALTNFFYSSFLVCECVNCKTVSGSTVFNLTNKRTVNISCLSKDIPVSYAAYYNKDEIPKSFTVADIMNPTNENYLEDSSNTQSIQSSMLSKRKTPPGSESSEIEINYRKVKILSAEEKQKKVEAAIDGLILLGSRLS